MMKKCEPAVGLTIIPAWMYHPLDWSLNGAIGWAGPRAGSIAVKAAKRTRAGPSSRGLANLVDGAVNVFESGAVPRAAKVSVIVRITSVLGL